MRFEMLSALPAPISATGHFLLSFFVSFPMCLQGMDRLLAMLMMFYFVSPEDTNAITNANTAGATAPVASTIPSSPLSHSRGGGGDLEMRKASAGGGGILSQLDEDDTAAEDQDRQAQSSEAPSAEPSPSAGGGGEGARGGGERGSENAPPQSPVAVSKSAPSGAPPTPRTPVPAPAEEVLLGERVFTVFSGLFEGFRLHDLYVPERGGVLVCTEVCMLRVSFFDSSRTWCGVARFVSS